MKRTIPFLLAFLFIQVIIVYAQDCVSYIPTKQGAKWELQHFDAKNKLTSTTKNEVKAFNTTNNKTNVIIETESFDSKGVSEGKNTYSAGCENGVFFIDMKAQFDPKGMSAFKDMQVKIDGDNLDFPPNLEPGQLLKPGKLNIQAEIPGMPNTFNMTTEIYNRKVEAKESVVTPAGTFNCIKITYEMKTVMMTEIVHKAVEWYAKDVGLVKNEIFDSNGKPVTSSVLSVFTK